MSALLRCDLVVLDGLGVAEAPGEYLVLLRLDDPSECALAAAPSVARFSGAYVVASRDPRQRSLPGFDGLSPVPSAVALPLGGPPGPDADVRCAMRAYASACPKTPTARALLAAVAGGPGRPRGAPSGPHRCWRGCDECNEEDCSLRVDGVLPGCWCPCHCLCLDDAPAEHVRSAAWLPRAAGRVAASAGLALRHAAEAQTPGSHGEAALARAARSVGRAADPRSSGWDRSLACGEARAAAAQAKSIPRGSPGRDAAIHAAVASHLCAVALADAASARGASAMDDALAGGHPVWRHELEFERACVASMRAAGVESPEDAYSDIWSRP